MTSDTRPAEASGWWEHRPHDADLLVLGHGATVEQAFEQAALAMMGAITDEHVEPAIRINVECARKDIELLLVDWLDAIIFEAAVGGLLFSRFEVRIEDGALHGAMWGERVDRPRHQPACEPKGATLTELHVRREADGHWSAGCVVDV